MTIADFISARYDEREAAAKAASSEHLCPPARGGRWQLVGVRHVTYANGAGEDMRVIDVTGGPCLWYEQIHVTGDPDAAVTHHIALNDPAYVLADIAAKRKILAGHTWSTEAPHGGQGIARCVACIADRDPYPELWEGDPWPCKTVRLLAEPFSGHPDYAAGWAPPALTGICPGCNGTLHQGSEPWHWYHEPWHQYHDDGNLSCPRRP